jgi:hypothetical protein
MQDAKARLSEIVELAESEGPQDLMLEGKSVAVVLSRTTFERISGSSRSLVDFMRQSPLHGTEDGGFEEIEFDRNPSR